MFEHQMEVTFKFLAAPGILCAWKFVTHRQRHWEDDWFPYIQSKRRPRRGTLAGGFLFSFPPAGLCPTCGFPAFCGADGCWTKRSLLTGGMFPPGLLPGMFVFCWVMFSVTRAHCRPMRAPRPRHLPFLTPRALCVTEPFPEARPCAHSSPHQGNLRLHRGQVRLGGSQPIRSHGGQGARSTAAVGGKDCDFVLTAIITCFLSALGPAPRL